MALHAKLFGARLKQGDELAYSLSHGHGAWLQVTQGSIEVNGETLGTGDGAAIEEVGEISILATDDAELLLFDLD